MRSTYQRIASSTMGFPKVGTCSSPSIPDFPSRPVRPQGGHAPAGHVHRFHGFAGCKESYALPTPAAGASVEILRSSGFRSATVLKVKLVVRVPGCAVAQDGIKYEQQFAHTSDQRELW